MQQRDTARDGAARSDSEKPKLLSAEPSVIATAPYEKPLKAKEDAQPEIPR